MNRVVEHYVSPEPFDPYSVERLTPEQERFYLASQWRMMWWKFRRHRLAVIHRRDENRRPLQRGGQRLAHRLGNGVLVLECDGSNFAICAHFD